ncbi:hypothetical protein PR202_gb28628 [Eleusine coracana subsp. coracana]|uniref:Uncharacterized protein n=1 Tax=Eleusine coracana subsp. coracana TaxID=191504 RepID=A0AAV5FYE4_ELECO|nr:hypothetical protein PR202_gb28628 [Eleusine coracana subsp. coracana]
MASSLSSLRYGDSLSVRCVVAISATTVMLCKAISRLLIYCTARYNSHRASSPPSSTTPGSSIHGIRDPTDCSMVFLYLLCSMSIGTNLQKFLGGAPLHAAAVVGGGSSSRTIWNIENLPMEIEFAEAYLPMEIEFVEASPDSDSK